MDKGRLTNDLGTHLLSFSVCERRGETAGDNVDEDWCWGESLDGGLKKVFRFDSLDEADIGTGGGGELQSLNSLLHTQNLSRVCSADDNLANR